MHIQTENLHSKAKKRREKMIKVAVRGEVRKVCGVALVWVYAGINFLLLKLYKQAHAWA